VKTFIVDTNVLLRFLLKDVPNQVTEAREKFQQAKEGKIELIIPQVVIFEIVFHLSKLYKFDKNKVIEGLKVILNTQYLKIQDRKIFKVTVQIFQKNNLSFVDCFLAAYSTEDEGEVFTFDQGLNKLLKSN